MARHGKAGLGKGEQGKGANMRIRIELIGKTPLMMHNERLSDADNDFTRQIKEITDKGTNQTEADKQLLSKLEWFGGVYTNGTNEIIIPTANLIKCFRETATITKDGRKIARALSPLALHSPLVHDGPKELAKLFANPTFVDRRQVKVGRGRIKRTRPIFPAWGLVAEFELLPDVLDFHRCLDIVERAGMATGLGDARILGFGRFSATVTKV
jgi:hypothetical protein